MKKAGSMPKILHINQKQAKSSKNYCAEVCGAKCCYIYVAGKPVRCPQLSDDNTCKVYNKRYGERAEEPIVVVGSWVNKAIKDIDGNYPSVPFYCGRIKDLLDKNLLAEEIRKECWYNDEV